MFLEAEDGAWAGSGQETCRSPPPPPILVRDLRRFTSPTENVVHVECWVNAPNAERLVGVAETRGFQQASTITTDLVKASTGPPALELVEKPIGRDFKYVEAGSAHA